MKNDKQLCKDLVKAHTIGVGSRGNVGPSLQGFSNLIDVQQIKGEQGEEHAENDGLGERTA
uniref:Uncharacterized protein n=1 Tax=Romanomermis culicivorax TaxID=13658 RepID=A0A915HP40_ROMCU